MRNINIELFKFAELDDAAKKAALENVRAVYLDSSDFYFSEYLASLNAFADDIGIAVRNYSFGQESAENGNYFIYADQVYAMADCMREESHTEAGAAGWHGSFSESAFSRLLVRLGDDNEAVLLGRES